MFSGYIVGGYYLVRSGGNICPAKVSYILEVKFRFNVWIVNVCIVCIDFFQVGAFYELNFEFTYYRNVTIVIFMQCN